MRKDLEKLKEHCEESIFWLHVFKAWGLDEKSIQYAEKVILEVTETLAREGVYVMELPEIISTRRPLAGSSRG